jgi:squalene-hopene/tetraprenyl-beta-curcumene cyclase
MRAADHRPESIPAASRLPGLPPHPAATGSIARRRSALARWAAPVAVALLACPAALAQAPAAPPSGSQQQLSEMERMVAAEVAKCPVKANPAFRNFGIVAPETTVELQATLTNPLDRPVKCIRSVPTCQCTTMDMLGKEIPARGSISVPVSMKTGSTTGQKTASVRMMFEGVPGLVEVKITADVAYAVRGYQVNTYPGKPAQKDTFVNAFDFPHQVMGEVTIETVDQKPFRLLSVQNAPPVFVDFNPASDAPRAAYRVRYDFSSAPCEQVPKYLIFETDRPDSPLMDMRVRHQCTRIENAFAFAAYRDNLGIMPVGKPRELAVEIKHANGVRIDRVESMDPRLAVQMTGTKSDSDSLLVQMTVTAQPGAQGVFIAPIRFHGEGPDPKRPIPPGQPPVGVTPRMADYLVYLKAVPAQAAAPAAQQAAGATPPAAAPEPGTPIALSPATREAVLAAPAVPMDTRINAQKVTKLADPTLPSRVVQPLPVVQRIAERSDEVPMDAERFARAMKAVDAGLAYLARSQGSGGGWMEGTAAKGTDQAKASNAASAAVTGLVLKAFAQSGRLAAKDPQAARALAYIVASTQLDGTFTPDPQGGLSNYVASLVLMGLAAQGDPALAMQVATVREWLTTNQWSQAKGVSPRDDWFGGAGYGRNGRPDLSNTQLMLDALHDAGVSPDDPAVQRALVFVQRTQNSRANPAPWAQAGGADGGFIYTPANGGESFASEDAGEGRYGEKMPEGAPRSLRSYGSMTYAGFKSMLYAGLAPDDQRVKDAFAWIRTHFTFDENPGLGAQGHFYYLHAMARALHAANQPVIEDAKGASHNWRDELVAALVARQAADGSWKNSADRWQESQPDLVTAYAVLALQEALKPVLRAQ